VRLGLALFAMPGIVFHELGHYIFCKLVGARVHELVLFRFGNPAGYVVHTAPSRFIGHFGVVMGPFVVNSAVAFAIFRASSSRLIYLSPSGLSQPLDLALSLLALWWGIAIALQAFPSKADARSLWHGAGAHLRRGNLLAVVGYPFVALIYAANIMKSGHLDFGYAIALFIVASAL